MQLRQNTDEKGQKGMRQRQAALVLVLAMLWVLAIAATANAYVAMRTETTLVDFDSGTFLYTGLLDLPEEEIDSVQLMPVGLAGDWSAANRTLPVRLANLGAVVSGNRIYVIGGTSSAQPARAEVYSYDVGPDGSLGAPQTRTALPEARAAAGVTVYDPDGPAPVIYVVGGFGVDWAAKNTVYRAAINPSTGGVGAWVQDSQVLPRALQVAPSVVHDGSLYVIGGWGGINYNVAFDKVYRAPIGPSGALGAFVETSPLPESLYNGVAIVYDGETTDTLYLIGGRNNDASTFKVYFADFLAGGGLTPWTLSEGNLPVHLYGHGGVYVRGQIILTGGVANSLDLSDGISSTVKAALVDPDNTTFRLYDWCENAPPDCTIGAWQTGALLPQVRALHASVAVGDYIYVLGGQDGDALVRDTIYVGSVDGAGAIYAPEGKYISDKFDLGQQAKLLRLEWDTTISRPDEMGLTMQYRYSLNGQDWLEGPAPVQSIDGANGIDIAGQPEDVVYFQYQANLSTTATTASPLLNSVKLYYEVPDPDLAVIKDTGNVISVALGSTLLYTITYANNGGWVAEDAVLTEYVPENATFDSSPGWQQVGDTNVYTLQLGDVQRGASGQATFQVRVNDEVPPHTYFITNRVAVDYPPMIDAYSNSIVDPIMDDNEYEFSNPLSFFTMTVSKDADPPPGSIVTPGSTIVYTVRYTNTGSVRASQTVLTDTLDPLGNYTVVSVSDPPDQQDGNIWTWDLGDLLARETGEVEITVQLGDLLPNNWLVANQAHLFSPLGDPYHTPVVTHTVMNLDAGGLPLNIVDLTVTDLVWGPVIPYAGAWPRFTAKVANIGTADALPVGDPPAGLWLALYIKPDASDPPLWPADHEWGYCLGGCTAETRPSYVGYLEQLPAGSEVEVVFEPLEPADPSALDYPAAGVYDVYVQVDVAFGGDNLYWGHYAEDDETNNLWQDTMMLVPMSGENNIYLPLVFKSAP